MITYSHPSGLPSFRDHNGHDRVLASFPSLGRLRKAATPFAASNPVIPRGRWQETNNRARYDFANMVFDQGQVGCCVACGWAGALAFTRLVAGNPYLKLSPGALYAQINGGQDQGAVISDGIEALQQTGTCLYSTVGTQPYYLNQLPAGWKLEAQRFRVGAVYHCASFDELATALQLGFVAPYGYMVGNDFEQFDRYGVAGHTSGPGNHCNFGLDLVNLPDGRWALYDVNSWGHTWGPFGNGCCLIDEQHLFGGGDEADVCVIQFAATDPSGNNPPAVQ